MNEVRTSYKTIADAYPGIAAKLKLFWGEQEFTDFVHDLINDTREHSRQGFPLAVTSALITLQYWHDHQFPQFAERTGNAWSLNFRGSSNTSPAASTSY